MKWMKANEIKETGNYLEVYPFFGFVPQFILVFMVAGMPRKATGNSQEKLDKDKVYFGPIPGIPPEMEIEI
jgi:hypothetical protein